MSNHLLDSTHCRPKIIATAVMAAFLLSLVVLSAWARPVRAGAQANSISAASMLRHPPAFLPLVSPSLITATKTYTLATDSDGDNQADPGDVLSYTIVISNDGSLVTGLVFSDTLDPNLSQLGLVSVSPIAFDDSYNAAANPLSLTIVDGPTDLFADDYPGLNPAVGGISSFGGGSLPGTASTTLADNMAVGANGSVTVNANGGFSFSPAAGFQGVFSFFYRLRNFVGSSDGLVQITVDAPPTVTTTSPANSATDVNGASNITINFSENVDISAGGITLGCPGPVGFSSTPTLPVSGTNTITLDPTANLPGNATCTVTVLAANTTDSDANDPPNQLDGNNDGTEGDNYVFSFQVAPTANDDSYNVTPHLTLISPTSVRANDDPVTVTITGFGPTLLTANGTVPDGVNFITAGGAGGRVVLNASGVFSYYPDAGDTNTSATFFYTVTGGDTATVTLTLQNTELVWFVDNTPGATVCTGTNNGTQACPEDLLADVAAVDTTNDTIYTASGAYTCGVTLQDGERLIGDGSSTTLDAITSITPVTGSSFPTFSGTDPTLSNASGNCLTLGSGNTIRGLTIGDTSAIGSDITGTNFGTLTLTETTLNGTGRALNLDTGTLNATLDGLTSTSGTNNVNLVGVGGAANLGSGSLSGATGTAFNVSGGNGTITYNGTIAKTSAGRITDIQNRTGGSVTLGGNLTCTTSCTGLNVASNSGGTTITFSGSAKILNTGGNPAVTLSSNTGATINFSGGGLDIDTTSGQGFSATGGGTVNVTTGASPNTINSTTGTALNVANTTIGGSGLTFRSISSNGGSNTGIILDTTGSSGGLTVSGTGSAGSGGTIANKTGVDGSTTTGIGIYLNSTSNVSLNWLQLNDFNNSAIAGRSVNGFTLTNSVINGVIGTNSAPVEGPINFGLTNPGGTNGLQGTGLIRNTRISGGVEHNVEFYNQSGSMSLTIDGTSVVSEGANPNSPADDVADCIIEENSVPSGSDGILIEMQGTAVATIVVDRCLFRDNKSQAVQIAAIDSSSITATIDENRTRRFDQGNEGFILSNASNADLTAMISNNHINNYGGTGIFVGQTAGNATASSALHASILNNTIDQPTTATNHGIIVFLTSTVGQLSQARVRVDGNTVTNNSTSGTTRGIIVDTPDTNTSPVFHATVTNNAVAVGDNVNGVAGIVVQARQSSDACANIGSNTVTFPNGTPGGVLGIRARQVSPATYDLEGSALCSGTAGSVLSCRNPASTTEVLGTLTVVPAGTCLLPAVP